MRFRNAHRIAEIMRPNLRWVGMRHYWRARWYRKHRGWDAWFIGRLGHKPRSEAQRGWMPGRWRLDGMQAPRRVINPAVRFWTIHRLCNEIRERRNKQCAWPDPYPWQRRKRGPRKILKRRTG